MSGLMALLIRHFPSDMLRISLAENGVLLFGRPDYN